MAGAGYKLFSTGDVLSASDVNLYLQQQTVMVFASAAARTTALASVLAEGMVTYLKDTDVVEIYTGAAWVSLDDPNAIQNSIVTAKGNIITATASGVPAVLAVGTNNQTLVADSSTATGLKWATASSTPTASGCQLRKSADQNITNNTLTTLTFDAEDFDTNSYHSLVTNTERITVPSTGYYLVNLQVMFATNTSGYRQIGLFKNGTRLNYQNAFATNGSTEAINVFNLMLSLTASDYLEIKVIQNSGGGVFVYGDNTNTRGTLFGITYLGA